MNQNIPIAVVRLNVRQDKLEMLSAQTLTVLTPEKEEKKTSPTQSMIVIKL